ncbi:prohibitin family protein [Spirosoma utsteinense]|uniref:Regulator of protease activity HflC (Stomatin/prohibitin superfamily) n=1 Tax=Spirosoma utsteinense TaxID=2585773 RepID=A0ABR6W706_9BACT|nr:prohibitin family protein [Spirosoma utsteinense]MBC3786177.1 regulator of protease activity HflC (stomatin/prohibitin superfamily) [Spirosoma utsteinense]MBC3792367.1 regulator of protease activity HflC (stomatin/prohibitin superfamily) [Spirosoma utsteinense]
MKRSLYPALLLALVGLTSCTVIRQGEVGVKRTLGKIKPGTLPEGVQIFNPLLTRIIKLPTRTVNLEVRAPLPSKEGLTVQSDISILYRVEGSYAPRIVEQIGPSYADVLILPVFRSAVTDVSSRYFAKDMHTGQRAEIERSIRDVMTNQLKDRGFVIESVLLKSISLPAGLTKAIEDKLAAEQDAQRMQFVLDKERQEAQRRIIEAEGTRDAQKIISEGLTPMLIRFKTVEAFNRLSTSPNSKVIITNGDSPLMLNADRLD